MLRNNEAQAGGDWGRGGGPWFNGPTLTATNLVVVDNFATNDGGGIYNHGSDMSITTGCFVSNTDLALYGTAGIRSADDLWWGHPTGPGAPLGSGLGDTASSGISVSSLRTVPPDGLDCDATVAYDCGAAIISDGVAPDSHDITFTTAEAGFTGLAFLDGTDVALVGFTPSGCESDGATSPCVATVTVTSPGSPDIAARFIVRTPSQGPTTCRYTRQDGLPVELLQLTVE